MTRPDLTRGACVGHPDPDLWFSPRATDREKARRICGTCTVQQACGTAAVAARDFIGVRAGLDGDELATAAGVTAPAPEPRTEPLAAPTAHATCGTPSGRRSHRRAGEAACDPCKEAATATRREERERARAARQDAA